MTREREEEIIKASQLYAKPLQKPFLDGARWADAHNEGFNMHIKFLKEELIDKAVEWLHNELDKMEEVHYIHVHGFDSERREQFLERFRKALEQ